AVTVTLLALALGGAARDVLHPYHMPVHRDLSRLMGAWQQERRADSGIWLMSPLASLPLTVQWYALQGVGGDPARLDSGAAELSRLTRRREWWVLNCDPDREGDPERSPRAQLAGAGYVIRQTSRLVLSRARPASRTRAASCSAGNARRERGGGSAGGESGPVSRCLCEPLPGRAAKNGGRPVIHLAAIRR